MLLTSDDRLEIHELMNLHGHLVDQGELDQLHELFTADVVYDLRDHGGEELRGIDAIVAAARALGDANPLSHHVTNVVITALDDERVAVLSKGIGSVSRRAPVGSRGVAYRAEARVAAPHASLPVDS